MFDNVDVTPVTLIDRCFATREALARGPGLVYRHEIIFDGRVYPLPRAHAEFSMPRVIAEWLFGYDRYRLSTTDGYVPRFGIVDGPDDLINAVGPEAFETSPLVPVLGAETWDLEAAGVDTAGRTERLHTLRQAFNDRQGGGNRSGFAPRD